MGKTETISQWQLTVLTFVSLLSPLIRMAPYGPVLLAGRAAWLSPLPALLAAGVLSAAVRAMVDKAPEGYGLAELSLQSLGTVGGRVFCVGMALWLTFYCGSIARGAAERLISSVFPSGGTELLVLTTLLVAVVTARGTVRGLAQTAELILPLLTAVVAVASLAAAGSVEVKNLLPVTVRDTGSVLLGGLPVFEVMGLHVYFLFLRGRVERGTGRRFPFLAASALTVFLIVALTVGAVGERLALDLQNAFLVVVRNARLFNVLERVESVVVAIWIITDFTMLAALLVMAAEAWRTALGTQKRTLFVAPTGVLAAVAAFFMADSAFELTRWTDLIIPLVNLGLTTLVIPAVLLIGKLRRKF